MARNETNFWFDIWLLINFVVLVCFTTITQFLFPVAEKTKGWKVLSLTYQNWIDMQFVTLCIFTIGLLIHLMLHWNWVCNIGAGYVAKISHSKREKPHDGIRTIVGVGILILLLHFVGGFVGIASLFIEKPPLQ